MFGSAGRIPRLLRNARARKTESVWAGEDIFNSSPVLRPQKCSLHVVKQRQSDQLLSVRLLKGMYSTGIWNFFVHSWLGSEWVVRSAKYFEPPDHSLVVLLYMFYGVTTDSAVCALAYTA